MTESIKLIYGDQEFELRAVQPDAVGLHANCVAHVVGLADVGHDRQPGDRVELVQAIGGG